MGNSQRRAGGSGASPVRRPTLAEREAVHAKRKAILDCLEYAGVPLEEQEATAKLLVEGGIDDADKLVASSDAILASLGVKPSVRAILVKAQEALKNKPASSEGGGASSSEGLPPVDPSARRKKSVAGPGNNRRESMAAKKTASMLRLTKFVKGDIIEHYRESDSLLRKGKVIGVHLDDVSIGPYYTILLEGPNNVELQAVEKKFEFPGVWEKVLLEKGIQPRYEHEIIQEPIVVEPQAAAVEPPEAKDEAMDLTPADEDLL